MNNQHKNCPTYQVAIYIAGDIATITSACRRYCMMGLCVAITPTDFAFTGGLESGASITLINYARFPSENLRSLDDHALMLAGQLMASACQRSCSVVTPTQTYFLNNPEIDVAR